MRFNLTLSESHDADVDFITTEQKAAAAEAKRQVHTH
jgi:hypothetical protein